MIEIEEHDSYEEVHQLWQAFNQRYKGGELALDWQLHRELWNRFHANRNSKLKIVVASDAGRCVGILPFSKSPADGADGEWVYGEEALVSREYFCCPESIDRIVPLLQRHSCTDLSCFYRPHRCEGFVRHPGCIVDLMKSETDYLATKSPMERADYLKIERMNADVEIVHDNAVKETIVGDLREHYIDYWITRAGMRSGSDAEESRKKILMDFALFARAEAMGKLVVLYFYLNNRLVAANFAVRREQDRIDDYLCLRDTDRAIAKRRIGLFAIIKNMQHCRALGIRYYDLSDFQADYKRALVNTARYYFAPNPATAAARYPSEGPSIAAVDHRQWKRSV